MKRSQSIILVLLILALVQMACSMPQPQQAEETPVFGLPTEGPAAVTATQALPTLSFATAPVLVTATTAPPAPTAPSAPTATTAASSGNNPPASCSYQATFISDVTIPDDSRIAPGTTFTKTWRVRNDGTCTWGPGRTLHALAFTGGSKLGGTDQVSIPANVAPGQSVDLSVNLVAPASAGVYTSEWKFRVDGASGVGPYIGLGPGKVDPLFTRIIVGATATPTATTQPATRISFAAGTTGAGVDGSVKAGATRSYVLSAAKGQLMMTSFSASSSLQLKVVDSATGSVVASASGASAQTQAFLPTTGDYLIQFIGGNADATFTLGVTIPSPISFASGASSASVDGKIVGRQPVFYLLRAQAGQNMSVKLTSPSNAVVLSIFGLQDGQVLLRSDFAMTEWSGDITVTQDYIILVMPSVETTTFSMTVTIK